MPVSGILVKMYGWPAVFYFFGGFRSSNHCVVLLNYCIKLLHHVSVICLIHTCHTTLYLVKTTMTGGSKQYYVQDKKRL